MVPVPWLAKKSRTSKGGGEMGGKGPEQIG